MLVYDKKGQDFEALIDTLNRADEIEGIIGKALTQ